MADEPEARSREPNILEGAGETTVEPDSEPPGKLEAYIASGVWYEAPLICALACAKGSLIVSSRSRALLYACALCESVRAADCCELLLSDRRCAALWFKVEVVLDLRGDLPCVGDSAGLAKSDVGDGAADEEGEPPVFRALPFLLAHSDRIA